MIPELFRTLAFLGCIAVIVLWRVFAKGPHGKFDGLLLRQRSLNTLRRRLCRHEYKIETAVVGPSHAPANQHMARIALARGDRKAAVDYLRRSLNGSLNREEVAKWITTLEALP